MNRRRRALLMLVAAAAAGLLAATLVGGYSRTVAESYGDLRTALVLTRDLAPGRKITARVAEASLEARQIPARFLPAGSIADPTRAVGLEPVGPLPAGSYLTAPALRVPEKDRPVLPAGRGRHPVEISVSGAGALAGAGLVDVLVTSDDDRGGGSTTVAASKVPLIAIGTSGRSEAGPGLTEVTLGLTRRQAIELVDAESFARRITILPRGRG